MSQPVDIHHDLHPEDFLLGQQERLRDQRETRLREGLAQIATDDAEGEQKVRENIAKTQAEHQLILARWTRRLDRSSKIGLPSWWGKMLFVLSLLLCGGWVALGLHVGLSFSFLGWSAICMASLPLLVYFFYDKLQCLNGIQPLSQKNRDFNALLDFLHNRWMALVLCGPFLVLDLLLSSLDQPPGQHLFPAPTSVFQGFSDEAFGSQSMETALDRLNGHQDPPNTLWLYPSDAVESQLLAQQRLRADQVTSWAISGAQALQHSMRGLYKPQSRGHTPLFQESNNALLAESRSGEDARLTQNRSSQPLPQTSSQGASSQDPTPQGKIQAQVPLCQQLLVCFPVRSLSEFHHRIQDLSLPLGQRQQLQQQFGPLLWLHTSLLARVLFNLLLLALMAESLLIAFHFWIKHLGGSFFKSKNKSSPEALFNALGRIQWPQRHLARQERESLRSLLTSSASLRDETRPLPILSPGLPGTPGLSEHSMKAMVEPSDPIPPSCVEPGSSSSPTRPKSTGATEIRKARRL